MMWALIFLFSCYFSGMMAIVYGFRKLPLFSSDAIEPIIHFSVIIPFRNEAENLPNLLNTIEALNYPSALFEVIFVNDASEDNSEKIVGEAIEKSKFSLKLIQNNRLSNSPKKDAITEAIRISKNQWMVTTDADCDLPKNWLKTLDNFIQKKNPVMVCGPVIYKTCGNTLENFQQVDGFSLQAVTIGSFGLKNPLLSNGANLAYTKDCFLKVNGFTANNHIASGDDIFLLEKVKKTFSKQIHFLKSKDFIVSTKPQKKWKNTINQRVRWASKTSKQKSIASLILGLLVLVVNIIFLTLPFFMIFDYENIAIYILLLYFKIIIDYSVVYPSAKFFSKEFKFWSFQWLQVVYASIIIIIVLKSLRGRYYWKGRTFVNQ